MIAVRATFAGFPVSMRCVYFGLHVRIEASCDEGWHVEGLADVGATAANE
jgi:hypothetical protein